MEEKQRIDSSEDRQRRTSHRERPPWADLTPPRDEPPAKMVWPILAVLVGGAVAAFSIASVAGGEPGAAQDREEAPQAVEPAPEPEPAVEAAPLEEEPAEEGAAADAERRDPQAIAETAESAEAQPPTAPVAARRPRRRAASPPAEPSSDAPSPDSPIPANPF